MMKSRSVTIGSANGAAMIIGDVSGSTVNMNGGEASSRDDDEGQAPGRVIRQRGPIVVVAGYSRHHLPALRELADLLRPEIDLWLSDSRAPLGSIPGHQLEVAIREDADYFMAVVGDAALSGHWPHQQFEIARIIEADRGSTFVIPLVLGEVGEDLNSLGLAGRVAISCADLSPRSLGAAARTLKASLRSPR